MMGSDVTLEGNAYFGIHRSAWGSDVFAIDDL